NTLIRDALRALSVSDQKVIDERLIELDGTSDKSRLGANAMVAVSLACPHADAAAQKLPLWRKLAGDKRVSLPVPQNQVDGGRGLDIPAAPLDRSGRYQLALENRSLAADELNALLLRCIERYPIVSIEDPFAADDAAAMRAFTEAPCIQLVGDDFFVTSAVRV